VDLLVEADVSEKQTLSIFSTDVRPEGEDSFLTPHVGFYQPVHTATKLERAPSEYSSRFGYRNYEEESTPTCSPSLDPILRYWPYTSHPHNLLSNVRSTFCLLIKFSVLQGVFLRFFCA
jgi:hypothetical protein